MTIMLEDWQAFTDFKSKNIEAERNKDSCVRSPICEKERPD